MGPGEGASSSSMARPMVRPPTHLVGYALFVVVFSAALAEAQETPPLLPGDLIRLETANEGQVTGELTTVSADSLVVRRGRMSLTVPVAELTRLERGYRKTRGESAWDGAKWGALILAIPGAISLAIQHNQVGEDGVSVPQGAALGAFSGGLFGGLIGAAIGASRPGTRWESIALSTLASAATRSSPSVGLTLTVGF